MSMALRHGQRLFSAALVKHARPIVALRIAQPSHISTTRSFSSPAASKVVKCLTSEAQSEKENYEKPEPITKFLKSGTWTLEDIDGDVNMALVRKMGDKDVRIEWQLTSPYNEEEMEDPGEKGEEEMPAPGDATDFSITVEDGTGCGITAYCSTTAGEGHRFVVGNVKSYSSKEEKESLSSFNGPEFEDLDDSLQESFDEYLSEVGMSDEVCDFIDAAALDKEQREYMNWLVSVKNFMSK